MSRRIVVALDFSPCSRRALDAAIELGHDLGASLVLVHAHTPPPRVAMRDPGSVDPITKVEQEIAVEEAVELSAKWASEARKADLEVETEARGGDPADVIADVAKEKEAFMIVVGSHGRKGLKRFILGSVAEAIVRKSDRPVLVVPDS